MNLFIGAFNNIKSSDFSGSGAGAKVQYEIINALRLIDSDFKALVMPELPSWPRSKLITNSDLMDEDIQFMSILNVSFLKRFVFYAQVLLFIIINKPRSIFSYNSSLISCVFSFLFKIFGCKRILILQDVNTPKFNSLISCFNLKNIASYTYLKILPFCYDFFIPITKSCINSLNLPPSRSEVFVGAVPLHRFNKLNPTISNNLAVFAGALEPYNGVDLLLDNWPIDSSYKIHVFGTGSLSEYVSTISKTNPNIVYHGFKTPEFVDEYLLKSKINFCFRYSKGLEQKFFFPSKFFDLINLPGFLVCNRFDNIPCELNDYIIFSNEDLSDISQIVKRCSTSIRDTNQLNDLVFKRYTWQFFLKDFCKRNFN